MKKEIRTFLIKLIGTFIVLSLIVATGKKLRSIDFEENYSSLRTHYSSNIFTPSIKNHDIRVSLRVI